MRQMEAELAEFEQSLYPGWVRVEITPPLRRGPAPPAPIIEPIKTPRTALERAIVTYVQRDGLPVHGKQQEYCDNIRTNTGLTVSNRTITRHTQDLFG